MISSSTTPGTTCSVVQKNIVSTTISSRDRDALPAYLLVHSAWFNAIDLATSLVVLGLGFVEDTKSDAVQVPIVVHSSVELCALLLLTIMLFLRTRLGYSLSLWMMCQLLSSAGGSDGKV